MKRTAFFISDGTGITAESLGRSLLAQFSDIEINMLTKPYIDTLDKAEALARIIESTAAQRWADNRSLSIPSLTSRYAMYFAKRRASRWIFFLPF